MDEIKRNHDGQLRNANFLDEDGNLFLVRCYKCDPDLGRENYGMSVASGQCAWCGWNGEGGEGVSYG